MPLRLYRRGDIWHYTGTVAGRRLRGSTKTALKDQAEIIANGAERRHLQGHRDPGSVLTFAQAAIEYRKARGAKRYLELVEDHWRDTPVRQITGGVIRRAALSLISDGSNAYRNRAVIVPTLAVINHAAKLDMCAPVRVERFPEVHATREPATWAWVQAFMAHASPHLGALCCFMFMTGARISEALAVTWGDVDLSAARARIVMGKVGGKERRAHMPPELVAALANIPGEREVGNRVFPYAHYRSCAQPWDVAIRRAGIERLTAHSCRHGFATTLLHAGVDVVTIAALGGWASAQYVLKTYGHARRDPTLVNLLSGAPLPHGGEQSSEDVVKSRKKA